MCLLNENASNIPRHIFTIHTISFLYLMVISHEKGLKLSFLDVNEGRGIQYSRGVNLPLGFVYQSLGNPLCIAQPK